QLAPAHGANTAPNLWRACVANGHPVQRGAGRGSHRGRPDHGLLPHRGRGGRFSSFGRGGRKPMGSRRKERLKGVYDALLGAADAPTPAPEDIPRPTPDAVYTPAAPEEPEHTPPHTPRDTPEHISQPDAEHDAGAPPAPTPAEEHTPPPAR